MDQWQLRMPTISNRADEEQKIPLHTNRNSIYKPLFGTQDMSLTKTRAQTSVPRRNRDQESVSNEIGEDASEEKKGSNFQNTEWNNSSPSDHDPGPRIILNRMKAQGARVDLIGKLFINLIHWFYLDVVTDGGHKQ